MSDLTDILESLSGQTTGIDAILSALSPDYGYGKRQDGTNKGKGYFGELPNPNGGISTELSVTVGDKGNEKSIPLIVPTLTKDELDTIISIRPGDKLPSNLVDKAITHAKVRESQGKSPYASIGEKFPVPK